MARLIRIFTFLFITILFLHGQKSLAFDQTYETCGVAAWDLLEISDYYQNKVPLALAEKKARVTENTKMFYNTASKEGLAEAQLGVLANYASCMKTVKQKAEQPPSKTPFYMCGDVSAANFIILSALKDGHTANELKGKLPENLHAKIDLFSSYVENLSFEYAVNAAVRTASICIEKAQMNP